MKTKTVKVFLSVLMVMLIAWAFSSCSKSDAVPTPTNYLTLDQAIVAAQTLLSTTSEGIVPGSYQKGSQATLQAAITTAQAVLTAGLTTGATLTQTQEAAATAQLTVAITNYQAAVIVAITGLVGQWTFDELTSASVGTTVKDYSGSNNNGTLMAGHAYWSTSDGFTSACGFAPPASYPADPVNVPTITTDRYGKQHALHFLAGANVDIPYSTSLNPQSITVTLWAKEDSLIQTGTYQWINNQYMIAMSRWNGWKFNMQNSPRAFFTANLTNSGKTGSDDRDDNVTLNGITQNWIHYAATFTNGTMVLYVNGVSTVTWSTANDIGTMTLLNGAAGTATAPQDLVIGQDLPTAAYTTGNTSDPNYLNYGGFYTGALDDIRVYSTALTAAQVLSIYNLEKP